MNEESANLIHIVSTSYGSCETVDPPFAISAEEALVYQGTLEGQTWVAASGDLGAANCTDPNLPPNAPTVSFPASLPSVLAVGGTYEDANVSNGNVTSCGPEFAWNDSTCNPEQGPAAQG